MHDDSPSNIVSLPFLAAARAGQRRAGAVRRPLRGVDCHAGRLPAHRESRADARHGADRRRIGKRQRKSSRARSTIAASARRVRSWRELRRDPGNLIEARLFGYEKGAFTGAARMHRGCFGARGGRHAVPRRGHRDGARDAGAPPARALGTRFTRVGGEEELAAACVIAATNRDPRQAVADGHLREDLMYRLAVFPSRCRPARARGRRRAPGRALPRGS